MHMYERHVVTQTALGGTSVAPFRAEEKPRTYTNRRKRENYKITVHLETNSSWGCRISRTSGSGMKRTAVPPAASAAASSVTSSPCVFPLSNDKECRLPPRTTSTFAHLLRAFTTLGDDGVARGRLTLEDEKRAGVRGGGG